MSVSLQNAWGNQKTEFFYQLTPERILSSVESLGLRCTGRLLQLNSMENRVYEVELETESLKADDFSAAGGGSSREKITAIVAKFYRPGRWSMEQIKEEHQFLFDLDEHDLPGVPPLAFEGESLFSMEQEGLLYSVFPKRQGRSPYELIGDQIEQIGRLIARMHNVGALREAKSRVTLSPEVYGEKNLETLLAEDIITPHSCNAYEEVVLEICELSDGLFAGVPLQRVHGDCHLGNLIWGKEGFSLVDFDDMVVGPCVQDLWLLFSGDDPESKENFQECLESYEQMRHFDRRTLRLIESLRALRIVHFSAWIAKRWEDPAFKKAFPEFASDRYWSEELRALWEIRDKVRIEVQRADNPYGMYTHR